MNTEPRSPHVLLIDEAPEIREILARALDLAGFRVTAEAAVPDLADVRRLAPDCIVQEFLFNRTDYQARAFLHALRQDAMLAHTPVLLCTVAHETVADPLLASELDALDVPVLLKPFDLPVFLARVALASVALQLQA